MISIESNTAHEDSKILHFVIFLYDLFILTYVLGKALKSTFRPYLAHSNLLVLNFMFCCFEDWIEVSLFTDGIDNFGVVGEARYKQFWNFIDVAD